MLRKLWSRDCDAFSSQEEAAVIRLASAHSRLVIEESGRVNTKSEAGFNSCALFLECLDASERAMHLDAAPRKYRASFTINYRALFPDEARNYRVDVLEASVEQYAVIWVNGDKFEFSAEAMRRAEALQRCWSDLAVLLERWNSEQARANRPSRIDVRNALVALDSAWASFEHKCPSLRVLVLAAQEAHGIAQVETRARCRHFGFTSQDSREPLPSMQSMQSVQSMQSLSKSVATDAKRDKATKALIAAELLERVVEEQRALQLRGQLATVEKLLGIDANTVDGLTALAAWRLVPGNMNGFTIDADRIASREANLQQRDKSWVSTAKLLAGCRMDEAWDSFQVEDVGRKVDDFLADLGAQKVYAD
eukprot:symbB.v1.2.014428.t2/scaffold1000.1/size145704/19